MKDYIDRLTELRIDHDLTQTDIAKELKVFQTTVSKYELKKTKLQVEDIITLCRFYNVSSDYILGLPEGMPYPHR